MNTYICVYSTHTQQNEVLRNKAMSSNKKITNARLT